MVEKGAVLVQLDDSVEQADLKANEAELRNAELDLGRQRELLRRGNTSQTAFDAALSRRDVAAAELDRTRAGIAPKGTCAPSARPLRSEERQCGTAVLRTRTRAGGGGK